METMTHPFIHTHSGKQWVVEGLTVDMIDIESIAHGLAKECRFGGQINCFYSVARHCLTMRESMKHLLPREEWIYALLHDAAEAYIGDIPKPIKVCLPDYNVMEAKVMDVIARKWELDPDKFDMPEIHLFDSKIVLDEALQLFTHSPNWVTDFYSKGIYPIGIKIEPRDWRTDVAEFLLAFHEDINAHLTHRRNQLCL